VYHTTVHTLLVSILGLMLSMATVRAQPQTMQIDLPLEPGKEAAAMSQLKTILTGMGGQINTDIPQTGIVGAMFPGGHQVNATAHKNSQGKTDIILTCSGESLAQAQERCKTVQRQYNP
jgi:hypothetical protein